jgi:hypothetical protein
MGLMRFRVVPTQRITEEMIQQAYLSGIERTCWPVRTSVEEGVLVLQRATSDSASLSVPWAVEGLRHGYGSMTLSTGSLMEQSEPYLLPLELARGTIAQVRNQLSDWQVIGLATPPIVTTKLAEAVAQLSWAAVSQSDPAVSAEHAEASLHAALGAADLLVAAYVEQSRIARRRGGGKIADLLGADLGTTLLDNFTARQFLRCFNAAEVPVCWRDTETTEGNFSWNITDSQIQWCRTHGLKVFAGPLLTLDAHALPDWLYLFADDFEGLMECVTSFVREAVERYRGQVDYWICAGRISAPESLTLSEHERMQLVAQTFELVRSLDPHTPVLLSFDQPWAEYLRHQESDFPPFHFADALIRAGLDLAGLMLDINVGYAQGGAFPRHPLELNRQLDLWSLFGLPLWLSFSAPSSSGEDPLAHHQTSLTSSDWTPETQQTWAARNVPLCLAKPMVQGVFWNQFRDSQPHDFPHGGLFDDQNQAKPSLRTLAAIRRAYME